MEGRYALALQLRDARSLVQTDSEEPTRLPSFTEEFANAAILCAIELKRILPNERVSLVVCEADELEHDVGAQPVSNSVQAVASIAWMNRLGERLSQGDLTIQRGE